VRPRDDGGSKGLRLLECVLATIATVSARFAASKFFGACVAAPDGWRDGGFGVRFACDDGQVNDVATAMFSSPNDAIGWMLSMGGGPGREEEESSRSPVYGFTPRGLGATFATYLLMMVAAFGTAVPGGVFMPSIFLGASGGGACGLLFRAALPASWDVQPGLYALIGATATLGGVFRSSISLVVIMVEGTGGISFIFCIIVAVVVSNAVSGFFGRHGVYHADLNRRTDRVAFLSGEPPRALNALAARDLTAGGPSSRLRRVHATRTTARVARELLRDTTHNGFPVVDDDGRVVGLILRSQLAVLLHAPPAHAAPGASADARRVLDAYMRVAHLREDELPRPIRIADRVRGVVSGSNSNNSRDDDVTARGGTTHSAVTSESLRAHRRRGSFAERGSPSRPGVLASSSSPARDRFLFDSIESSGLEGGNAHDDDDDGDDDDAAAALRRPRAPRDSGGFGSEIAVGPVGSPPRGGGGGGGGDLHFESLPALARDDVAEDTTRGGVVLDDGALLDVAAYMRRSPLAVKEDFPATRVHGLFCALGLRHLIVTDDENVVVGVITRKDVMRAIDRR
jgi:CBS domain-containing protein